MNDAFVWLLLIVRRPGGLLDRVALELPRPEMTKLVEALDKAHAAVQPVRI